jgi:formate hydrogenlyase subunit 3/multisubunit Na+/H+ antiporter MnhD subunit
MTMSNALLTGTLALPLVLLAACLWSSARDRMLPWLVVAPLPALLAALGVDRGTTVTLIAAGSYEGVLALDAPGALLLGVAALLWSAAGAYAATYQRDLPNRGRFAAAWLLCLTGCLGVFVAADMPLLYLMLATMTLGATALVFQDESAGARRAAAIYLGLALAGETLVLVAMILLAQATADGSLLIRDAAAVLPTAAHRDLIVALLIIGFGLKAGLVPLHVWMPLAHAAAPMPASAVLSGVVVKAGIIGLIRFLPVDAGLADWGNTLAVAGMFTALYAVAIGITQPHPKVVLAYSSVSQMGFTAAVIGMGIASLDAATPVLAAFYATHHILVKGAMFLLVGVVAATAGTRLRGTLLLAAVLAVGLGGLPLTGGAVAKLAVKGPLGSGWAATVAYASAVGTTLLMLHFLRRVAANSAAEPAARAAAGLRWPWLVTAIAALVVPWAIFLGLSLGTVAEAVAPKALWASLWPVGVGAALAWWLARAGDRLPRIPPGDVAVVIDRGVGAGARAGAALLRADRVLQQWTIAGVSLLVLAALFGLALVAGR